ncbi:MAG: DegT/DnrJ/EryC1/StrS aminotransferase [Bradyrhizobium sp.]|nr:DegT/DnrJ/EryC1/StrS aminotransferase [Bradyrhizobium sp.]
MKRFRAAIDVAIGGEIAAGTYVLGPAVEKFETEFAAYLGARYAVGVGSGTDAVTIAFRALGIGRGDEVITTSLTAAGTAQGILASGATLRFAEVDKATRCLDPRAVEAAVTPRTAAVVAVHLFGQPCDVVALGAIADRYGLVLIEDAAQAHGATIDGRRVGTFGHAAAFSFYPTKPLGAIGDGGAVVTNDPAVAGRARALRTYGWDGPERISRFIAGNSRLDSLQAAILSALLPTLETTNRERVMTAAAYLSSFSGLDVDLPMQKAGAVYHQFAIAFSHRDRLRQWLMDRAGIATAVHYHPALHQQPAFAELNHEPLPNTEALASRLISLPIEPELAGPNLARIIEAVSSGIAACGK